MLEAARKRTAVALALAHDVAAASVAWCAAYWLRFNLEVPEPFFSAMLLALVWVVPIQAGVFWLSGLYRGMWRFTSLTDLRYIAVAVTVSAVAIPLIYFLTQSQLPVPRTVLIIDPVLLAVMMSGSRLAYRYFRERQISDLLSPKRKPVLVLGAGEAAEKLINDIHGSRDWRVVGLLDDDRAKHGRNIHGIRVLASLEELPRYAGELGIGHAIIAMPSVSHSVRRRAAELCLTAGIRALTVPSFDDLLSGKITISSIRNIELDDLLGRDPVQLDSAQLRQWLHHRVVLVTGAGGSIGAELCRQIARFDPELLVMLENNEFALYSIAQEFADSRPQVKTSGVIADVRNAATIDALHARYRPSVVFHAAAYKHVPLMEDHNAGQAVENNVLGTLTVARAANAHGAEKFVLVSTDKAVNPTNVMGATKRLAELVCQGLQQVSTTRFVMVRFGNVLGSTGSVIPRFRAQIEHGGPVTVTHPEVTRYFMSIPEAAQLVLQAGWMGKGGEIVVLDMGDAVKIADLAREMIRLSGFSEDDIRIVFTGLKPGEKLFEEVLSDREKTLPTPHPKLRVARADHVPDSVWMQELERWLAGACSTENQVKRDLAKWVPEYRPASSSRS